MSSPIVACVLRSGTSHGKANQVVFLLVFISFQSGSSFCSVAFMSCSKECSDLKDPQVVSSIYAAVEINEITAFLLFIPQYISSLTSSNISLVIINSW